MAQTSQAALISPSAHVYERLSDVGSPVTGSPPAGYRTLPLGDESDSDNGDYYANRRRAPASWLQRIIALGQKPPPPVQSNYLTLIPLSDDRLKPRHTAWLVFGLLLVSVAFSTAVFVLVPRGVTVGSIQVHSSRMSFNTSKSTYQIILTATISIFNPNYLPVEVSGSLVVSFYDQQAGVTGLDPVIIPARAFPQVITVDMDASSVPEKYLFTIYTQCFTFPERIIFFLTGKLQSKYLAWRFQLPDIDNYFIISCTDAPTAGPTRHASPAAPPSRRTRRRRRCCRPSRRTRRDLSRRAGLRRRGGARGWWGRGGGRTRRARGTERARRVGARPRARASAGRWRECRRACLGARLRT